jgi:DNA-directed RNA polymerase subunit RPC12/RpoP
VIITEKDDEGFCGMYYGFNLSATLVCTWGAGWEHVSISPTRKSYTPSWDDMCRLKDVFFKDDEAVIQIHPPKSEYVNNMPNCLHLWRCTYKDMVLPPAILVGVKKGQTSAEVEQAVKAAYAEAEGQSVNPEIKTGYWVKVSPEGSYQCSECGKTVKTDDIDAYMYCHGCGIKINLAKKYSDLVKAVNK